MRNNVAWKLDPRFFSVEPVLGIGRVGPLGSEEFVVVAVGSKMAVSGRTRTRGNCSIEDRKIFRPFDDLSRMTGAPESLARIEDVSIRISRRIKVGVYHGTERFLPLPSVPTAVWTDDQFRPMEILVPSLVVWDPIVPLIDIRFHRHAHLPQVNLASNLPARLFCFFN